MVYELEFRKSNLFMYFQFGKNGSWLRILGLIKLTFRKVYIFLS